MKKVFTLFLIFNVTSFVKGISEQVMHQLTIANSQGGQWEQIVNVPAFSCSPQDACSNCIESCEQNVIAAGVSAGQLMCVSKQFSYFMHQIAKANKGEFTGCMQNIGDKTVEGFLELVSSTAFFKSLARVTYYNSIFKPCFEVQLVANGNAQTPYQYYQSNQTEMDDTYKNDCPNPWTGDSSPYCPCLIQYEQDKNNPNLNNQAIENQIQSSINAIMDDLQESMYSSCKPALKQFFEDPTDLATATNWVSACPLSIGKYVNEAIKMCGQQDVANYPKLFALQYHFMSFMNQWLPNDCEAPQLGIKTIYGQQFLSVLNFPNFFLNIDKYGKKLKNLIKSLAVTCPQTFPVKQFMKELAINLSVAIPLGLYSTIKEQALITSLVREIKIARSVGYKTWAEGRFTQIKNRIKAKMRSKGQEPPEESGEDVDVDPMGDAAADITGEAGAAPLDALESSGITDGTMDAIDLGLSSSDLVAEASAAIATGPIGLAVMAGLLIDAGVALVCRAIAVAVTQDPSSRAANDCDWINPLGVGISYVSSKLIWAVGTGLKDIASDIEAAVASMPNLPALPPDSWAAQNLNVFSSNSFIAAIELIANILTVIFDPLRW